MDAPQAIDRVRADPLVSDWIKRLDDRLRPGIDAYLDRPSKGEPTSKAVKDALWGMVDLDPCEVIVIDSPPFQRLRRIRQLGTTYLTFPTAGYSRFEHSIGAMHQANRMLDAIKRRSAPDVKAPLEEARQVLRLAALVHDIGHLPLSHIAERSFGARECTDPAMVEEVEQVLATVTAGLSVPERHLSETLSFLVLLTPSFGRLLATAGYPASIVATVGAAILGRPPSKEQAFVAQIISNALDADKLDYLFRDALATGVPLAVDLERLLYKLVAVRANVGRLQGLLRKMGRPEETAVVLGTDLSGFRLIKDLLVSRQMLFERIYLHHKTRAAERLALDHLRDRAAHPIELIALDDTVFVPEEDETEGPRRRLADRQLPRRAVALSYGFLANRATAVGENKQPKVDGALIAANARLTDVLNLAEQRELLGRLIAQELDGLRAVLGAVGPRPYLWLEPTPRPPEVPDADLYLIGFDKEVKVESSYDALASGFTRDPAQIVFVFGDGGADELALLFIATQLTLAAAFGLELGNAEAEFAKLDTRDIDRIKRDLERAAPETFAAAGSLRPPSEHARTAAADGLVTTLARRFRTYDAGESGIDDQHILGFLDQFPEDLVPDALEMVQRVRFLDRGEIGHQMTTRVKELGDDVCVVPLTSAPGKSAALLQYYMNHHPDPPAMGTLVAALAEDRPIAVVDDVLLSGKQARTVVQRWMGLPLDLVAEAHLAEPLDDAQRARVAEPDVVFTFLYGTAEGRDHLAHLLAEAGMRARVELVEEVGPVGSILEGLDPRLSDFLRSVGRSILRTSHADDTEKWTDQLCDERSLGYGGRALGVTTSYNCPTSTVTALWSQGEFRRSAWRPLFPRR